MIRAAKPRPMFLLSSLLVAMSATAGIDLHVADQKDGLPETDDPRGPVYVHAVAYKYSTGFLSMSAGNGFAGRQYAWASRTPSAKIATTPNGCAGAKADPILTSTGTKVETYPLFSLPGEMGLSYVLYYQGGGWTDNLTYSLDPNCNANPPDNGICKQTTLYRPDGSTLIFNGGPTATAYAGRTGVATLTRDTTSGNYTLHDEDATTEVYSSSGILLTIKDASGVGWTFSHSGQTVTVTHTSGQSFTKAYTANGETLTDPGGNTYTLLGYSGAGGSIASITYPGTPATVISFKYLQLPSPPYGSRLSEVDYNGVPYGYTTYDMRANLSGPNFPNPFYGWATGTYSADGSGLFTIAYNATNASLQNLSETDTNALGHQSTTSFDSNGNITQISDNAVQTCGATISGRTYDSNQHLAAEVDNNGNTRSYTYAANGQLQTETEAYGTPIARTTDYVWDPNIQLNRLLSVTVEGWRKTVYSYNAQNRLASTSVTNLTHTGTSNETLTTTNTYSLYGNGMVQAMTVTRPTGNGDVYAYDTRGNLTSVTDGLGLSTTYSSYNGLGQPGHIVGANGDVTDITYDARGRVIRKTSYPNGAAASWTYTYDGFGRLASETDPDGQVTSYTRDAEMRLTSKTHNDKDGTSTESFSYDANGDVISHTVARGSVIGLSETFHYDALGRLYQRVGQNGQLLVYAYDGNGNGLSVTNALGHAVSYQYDALNRAIKKTESDPGVAPAIPGAAPTINTPTTSTTGSYTVSWNSITGATSYVLQEQINGGGWTTLQSSGAISWPASSQSSGTYSYQVQACNASGCSAWSAPGTTTVSNANPSLNPIGLNGKTYTGTNALTQGSGNEAIGFDIANGNAWEVFTSKVGNPHVVVGTGPTPAGAVSVQLTWVDGGVPAGESDALGSVTNPAASPVPLSSNPSSQYLTGTFNFNSANRGHLYTLHVDFFNASGTDISTSSCVLDGEVQGNQ